jgi:putative DNA methylase
MSAPPRKKLIEVSLPLAKINEAAAKEKSIRHGHPSTLHLWWARRPLAACRAVLFASLVDDPDSDPMYRSAPDLAALKRAELFNLIEELVQWDNSNNARVINKARAEIARCVASRKLETSELKPEDRIGSSTVREIKGMLAGPDAVNAFLAEHAPPVLDPFCGGGSIPLEAQRLGLRTYASDLNPVAVLITKALIEIPPKFAGRPPVNPAWQQKKADEKQMAVWEGAKGLADDVRYYGKWMREQAEKRIGHLYPKVEITEEMAGERPDLKEYVGEELTVIAWLWARTVASPNPAVGGVHVPLVRSFWLSTKKGKEAWVRPVIQKEASEWHFVVGTGQPPADFDPQEGTVNRTGGTCLLTGEPIPLPYIRAEGKASRLSRRLMAIVAEGTPGRIYLSPNEDQQQAAAISRPLGVAETDIPQEALGFRVQLYGMNKHYSLFTPRQLTALSTFADLIADVRTAVLDRAKTVAILPVDDATLEQGGNGYRAYADAIALFMTLCLGKLADLANSLCAWEPIAQCPRHLFGKQTISMVWDFAEGNPLGDSSGSWSVLMENNQRALESPMMSHDRPQSGTATQLDASSCSSIARRLVVSTDPPYYDNIGYADLSDFFYIWLRRALASSFPTLFSTLLTPKTKELIAAPYRHANNREAARKYFEQGLGKVFAEIRSVQNADYPVTIFYAFKQAESDENPDGGNSSVLASTGWETILDACINAQWTIDGTWPIRTEMGSRLRGMASNALATSIVLVCRSRPSDAPLATRKQFISGLRHELPDVLRILQHGNIAPVDMAQAAIGPGMAVFTRYSKVIESDGSPMTVRTALGIINQVLDEVLAEQEGDFDAESRWALAWFEQHGMEEGLFGVAETLSKAKNTAINGLTEAGIVKAKGGKVRLVKRDELPED